MRAHGYRLRTWSRRPAAKPTRPKNYSKNYDKEKNPFYYLLYGGGSYCDLEFSKNNIVNLVATNSEQETSETEFTYVYDGGYPVERTVTYITEAYTGGTNFYEYK